MKKHVSTLIAAGAILIGTAAVMKEKLKGIDQEAMDKTINPGEDFYRFANGNWLKNNPVPASESRWGSFNLVSERNNETLRQILEEAAANTQADPNSVKGKVGTFYRLYMDTLKRDAQGSAPLKPVLDQINAISSKPELIQTLAKLNKKGFRGFFGFYIGQDLKNSTQYIAYMGQGGLSLPDRDYYLKNDKRSNEIREEYKKYIGNLSALYNESDKKIAEKVIGIETVLASGSMTRTERRNQEKQYNKRGFSQVLSQYPAINLGTYTKEIGLSTIDSMIVSQPAFFSRLDSLITATPLEDLKAYLGWHAMNTAAGYLGSAFEKENFAFYGTTLTGTKEQKPMWKRGISAANGIVGELLGQLFVEKSFSPESKKRVNAMVDNIMEAFRIRLGKLEWMSEPTRAKALEKLASFTRKFGYPDKWTDYSSLEIKNDSYLENYMRAAEFGHREMVEKLGKPIDRNRWGMLPQTVNAYYNPTLNEIVFPAAIMQPPFFDANADEAVNYGSIGAVIGHELTHGFDDQGSKYGADGNLKSWWTEDDRKLFEKKTQRLVEQYNGFFVSDSLHVNGELTLGENIADLGGLTIAFDAFKMYLKKNPGEKIGGFTPEQRFFIGFAQIWKNNARPEAMRQLILTDPHSPGEFRVLGPLSNMPAFYEAFGVKKGQKMYKTEADRALIW
ncbi:MAG: M13 family metallopeptidase [Bacteroidetes bacterium]|nr:M13 family metallopeptidase [Bacteroidota bacterium]